MHGYGSQPEWEAVPPAPYPAPTQPWPGYAPPPAPYPPSYGAAPFHGPGYFPGPQAAWPAGPARPGLATTAAVLGFVTAGLSLLTLLSILVEVASGTTDDAASVILLLGIPAAAGLITGAVRLLGRRSPAVLFGSGLAAIGVLALAWIAALASLPQDDVLGVTAFVVMALPLPVLTTTFAWTSGVRRWAASAPR